MYIERFHIPPEAPAILMGLLWSLSPFKSFVLIGAMVAYARMLFYSETSMNIDKVLAEEETLEICPRFYQSI